METIHTSVAALTLLGDSIILLQVNSHSDLGVKGIIEIREANFKLNNGNPYCVLMEAGEFTAATKEAREVSATKEHAKNRIAMAIIQNNVAIKLLTIFYLKINKPVSPTKPFRTKEEALVWLREMRDSYYSKHKKK